MLPPLRDYPFASRPLIAAHRGNTSGGARENTVEAIVAALPSGAEMIEVDVQQSSDQVFVCYHDESFDGIPVWQWSSEELASRGVSTLEQILDAAAERVYFNLEVKEYSARDPQRFMASLNELVERRGLRDTVLFSSFRIDYLRHAGWHVPSIVIRPDEHMIEYFNSRSNEPIVLAKPLANYLPSELIRLSRTTGYACSTEETIPQHVADILTHNLLFCAYTITTDDLFREMVSKGVQAMVCEDPAHFVQLRDSMFPQHV